MITKGVKELWARLRTTAHGQGINARVPASARPYVTGNHGVADKGGPPGAYSLLKNRVLDPELLAYLWMAVESGANIVISGAQSSGNIALLSALSMFMPRSSSVITIVEDLDEVSTEAQLFNTMALYGPRYPGTSPRAQIASAIGMHPDRIVCDRLHGEEARELFSGANSGTSFLTTMYAGDNEPGIVSKLLTRPMSVEYSAIGMLDLSIHLSRTGRHRPISSVLEYLWLSRAETDAGMEIGGSEIVRELPMVESSRLVPGFLDASKIISSFSYVKCLSQKDTKAEFFNRAHAIMSAYGSSRGEAEFLVSLERPL